MFFTSSGQLARICVLFMLPAMRETTFVRIIDIVPACNHPGSWQGICASCAS